MSRAVGQNRNRAPAAHRRIGRCVQIVLSILLVLLGDGVQGRASAQESVEKRFADVSAAEIPDFQRHIVPLLGRLGCNGRSCHGSFQGRGGLRLSLFGYDFRMDHDSLTARGGTGESMRVNRDRVSESLILQKPLMQIPHEGGRRFREGAWEHNLLRRWIEGGAQPVDELQVLQRLEATPAEILFEEGRLAVGLTVTAIWEDGRREDVTGLCRFRTNDDSVAVVDVNGNVTSAGSGDSHVVAFYDNGVVAVPVLRPFSVVPDPLFPSDNTELRDTSKLPPESVDHFVVAKLDKLGLQPSPVCPDDEFLRRISLDLTGTLPTPNEVREFLDDERGDKRERKIDELLDRPAYAAWWANKLCDFTGCNPNQQAELGQETSVQWYMWIYRRLQGNTPYDELVRRIVLARGLSDQQSYDEYAAQTSAYFRDHSPADFSERSTMPHYWTRRSMQEPEEAAQAFAQNFLGIRLQCAQCHKHPFAPWTQKDFTEFSRFFEPVRFGVAPEHAVRYRGLAQAVGLNVRRAEGEPIRNDVLRRARRGETVPWRELYIQPRPSVQEISLLRSGVVLLKEEDDPRRPVSDWMTNPQNPWFATAIVNRIWAGYFHRGIVDPPDDLNPANPPSHPHLLQFLVDGFIDSGFDMKWLHRTIVTSQTYQRSWKPNTTNAEDQRNYSRAIPRRLPAEVVYDALKQALAADTRLAEVRTDLSRRAIGHLSMRLAGTHAMKVFGKPDRAVNCDCERVNSPTLLQSVFLQNDPLVDQLLESSGWLEEVDAQQAGGEAMDKTALIEAAWLRTVSRPPTAAESSRARQYLGEAGSLSEGLRDVLWALINTKEFILIR